MTAPDRHADRRDRLRRRLATAELSAALVTRLVNVRYLTGFTGSNAALLVGADGADLFATDGRYLTQAAAQVPDLTRIGERAVARALAARAAQAGHRRLAYESHAVTVDQRDALSAAAEGVELARLGPVVEELRSVKDETEIVALRQACAIADRALAELIEAGGMRAGRTEREIARDLDARMLDLGAQAASFPSIVAGGPHSAIPHHEPTGRPLEPGDFLKLDFGATVAGYHSDMTRTLVVGRPASWQREIYELVAAAQRIGREALVVGADCRAVDGLVRDHIAAAGHGAHFPHGLGHGVGLEIHEAPALGIDTPGTLADRMTVTVEPGVYLAGRGGVRIEDTLVVRAGGPELLTLTTRDLTVL